MASEPRTEAGRTANAYANEWHRATCQGNFVLEGGCDCGLTNAILAIEAEATTSPEPARSGAEGPTPGQAERLVSEMIGVESAIQQAMDRAQKVTRTLAALTVVVEDRPRFAATTTSPEPDPTEFTNPRYATGLTGAAYNLLTAIENGDRPNVHGWSVALRKELDAYLAGAPVDRALAASKPDTDERERVVEAGEFVAVADRCRYSEDDGCAPTACEECGAGGGTVPHAHYDWCNEARWERGFQAGWLARLTLGSGADEGLREAARKLADEAARAVTEPRRFHENEDERQQALGHALTAVRAALADSTNREAGDA